MSKNNLTFELFSWELYLVVIINPQIQYMFILYINNIGIHYTYYYCVHCIVDALWAVSIVIFYYTLTVLLVFAGVTLSILWFFATVMQLFRHKVLIFWYRPVLHFNLYFNLQFLWQVIFVDYTISQWYAVLI